MKQALAAVPLLERDRSRTSIKIAADAQLNNAREERGVGRRRISIIAPAVRLEDTTGALLNVAEVAICDERRPQKLLDGLAFMWYDLDIEGGLHVPQNPILEDPVRKFQCSGPRIKAPLVLRKTQMSLRPVGDRGPPGARPARELLMFPQLMHALRPVVDGREAMPSHMPLEHTTTDEEAARAREERHVIERDARRRGEADI